MNGGPCGRTKLEGIKLISVEEHIEEMRKKSIRFAFRGHQRQDVDGATILDALVFGVNGEDHVVAGKLSDVGDAKAAEG